MARRPTKRPSPASIKAAVDRAERRAKGEELPEAPADPILTVPPTTSLGRGRPTDYKPEFVEQAKKLCALGATDDQLADFFGVNQATINRWKVTHQDFCESMTVGKTYPDNLVERALYQRAIGYTFEEEKTVSPKGAEVPITITSKVHVPPDVTAARLWLLNRRRNEWRDVQQVEVGRPGDFDQMSDDEIRNYVAQEAQALGITLIPATSKGSKAQH